MATKTLGIKFEIAGVKEAQAGLNNLRNNLNQSLQHNKKVASQAFGISAPKNNIVGTKSNSSLKVEVASTIGKDLDEWGDRFSKQLEDSLKVAKSKSSGLVSNVFTGFQEGIGNEFARQYAGGLDKGLGGKLFKFFEANGNRQGKFASKVGSSVAKSPEAIQQFGLDKFFNVADIYLEGLKNKVNKKAIGIEIAKEIFNPEPFKQQFKNAIAKAGDSVKSSLGEIRSKVGVGASRDRKLEQEGYNELLKTVKDGSAKNIEVDPNAEEVVLVVGGFAGKKGRSGSTFAKQIAGMNPDSKSQYVGVRNDFTDVVNVREAYGGTVEGQLESMRKILRMFQQVHKQGFNPDAVKLAAQTLKIQQQNPDKQIKLAGYSGGGYVVEDAMKLLRQFGADMSKIQGKGIATPNLPGSTKQEGFDKTFGATDNIFEINSLKEINKKAQELFGIDIFSGLSEDIQNIKDIDNHFLDSYIIFSEEIKEFLYGQNSNVDQIIDIHKEIIAVQSIIEQASQSISNLSTDSKGFNPVAFEKLQDVYIHSLKRLQELGKAAKKAGGGAYYDNITKQSTESLKELGYVDKPEGKLSNKELAKQYNKHLQQIIIKANKKALSAIKNNDVSINTENSYQNIKQKIAEYRRKVSDGAFKAARKIGEELLEESEYLKQVFESTGDNRKGQLTRIQNEIISGDLGKGRSSIGLANLSSETDAVQLELDLSEAADGAGSSLNRESGQEIGSEFAEGIVDGAEDELDINSPSRVFQWIGEMIKAGLTSGVNGVGEELAEELAEGRDESTNKFKRFFSGISDRLPILGKLKKLLLGVSALFIGGMGINFAINLLNQLSKEALATAMALESVDRAILFISRNSLDGLDNIKYITEEAKSLSVGLNEAKEAYSGLLGAAKNTPLEGEQTKRIFSAFAASAANRGIDAQSQTRLFTALEQIVAKRKLGAEEVVQQIGDIRGFGDFKGLVGQAKGVSSAELDKLMSQGEVKIDVLPKIAALLEAQNAANDGTQTAQQALTQYNNSLLEFKGTLGSVLQPLEKLKLNVMSAGLDFITEKLELIFTLITVTGGVALLAIISQIKVLTVAGFVLARSLDFVTASLAKLWAAKFALLGGVVKLAGAYALVFAAYKAWSNVIDLSKNQYQELEDGADKMAAGIDRYSQALADATQKQDNFNASQSKFELNEGLELKGWFEKFQGIAGGDRLNLDNLVRKRLDRLFETFGGNFTTEAERREADLAIAAGKISLNTNKLLTKSPGAQDAAKKINEFDRQIRAVQSKRLDLLPGDKKALEASLAEERAINQERDKYLKILTTYQQELQGAVAKNKAILATPQISDFTRKRAENDLKAAEIELEGLNSEISAITKSLSEFERQLRNSSERIDNFIERRGLAAQAERTQIISDGIDLEKGDRVIQLELDAASRREIGDYITELETTINQGSKRLQSGALAEGLSAVQRSTEQNALTLDSKTLERMLNEERDEAEKDALSELLEVRRNQTKLNQYREQLAQNLQATRTSLIDYNRTISDYFFRLNQQIKEATLEGERLVSELFYGNIKNRLRSAIAPGSNTFVNGIIDNIQSVIDQASQVAQKVFGDRAAELGFESESRTLATEMQDFIRQIGNAGDAVENFVNRLRRFDSQSEAERSSVRLNGSKPAPNSSARTAESAAFPITGLTPDTARITSGYGWRTIFGRKDFHEGIDIAAKGGTKVRNTNSGIVKKILPLADQTQVGIETAEGVMEWFIHLGQNLKVSKGDHVTAGQVIGFVAHTTQRARNARVSTGDHLDYRVQVNGKWVNPMEFIKSSLANKSNAQLVSNNQHGLHKRLGRPEATRPPQTSNDIDSNISSEVVRKNQELLAIKRQTLDTSKLTTEQEREALAIAVEQTIEANKRQVKQGLLESQRTVRGLEGKFADFGVQYDYQSAENQAQQAIRNIKQQFLDAEIDLNVQITNAEDAIATIKKSQSILTEDIAKFEAAGTPEGLAAAEVAKASLAELTASLPKLEANLERIREVEKDSEKLQEKYNAFVESQNQLKIEQEKLNKRSLLLNQQAAIAQQRGTLEQRRQLQLHQEDLRLALKINELKQKYKPGAELDALIKGERRQSQVNTENINYDSQIAELDLEKRLLDYNSNIGTKKAGLSSRFGVNFGAEKLKKENAIAQENLRFERELVQLRKEYQDRPEELEKLSRAATELNRVSLSEIENQFRTLGQSIEESFGSSVSGLFEQFTTNFFDGKAERDRAEQDERLRYAEELNQLNEQYKDEPGKLQHLKDRAKELNESKLDKIKNEFSIFGRAVDLAKQALLEFVKQLAKLAAQQAAAKFISTIIGGAIGGAGGGGVSAVGNDFGSGVGAGIAAFTADEGATVGSDDINKRKIGDRSTNILRRTFPGIAKAFSKEGEGARFGVFHVGEELLSRKTGEAGRYQALKAKFGFNPLEKIANFADGGTIGGFDANSNILAGFSIPDAPRLDLSQISDRNSGATEVSKSFTLHQTVVTPSADSFGANADQRNQDTMESFARRGFS